MVKALDDASPSVRTVAAEALARFSTGEDQQRGLKTIVALSSPEDNGALVSIAALNAADRLVGERLLDRALFAKLSPKGPSPHARYNEYAPRLLESML